MTAAETVTERTTGTGQVHGITVHSEVPGFDLTPTRTIVAGDPDAVVIRSVEPALVPSALDDAPYERVCVQANATELLVRVPGTARFLVREGREILVAPEPGASEAHLRLHLEQVAWPGLLQQRGRLVLRGTAVARGDDAVILTGHSGFGSSTLGAVLHVRHGFAVLADAVCAIDLDDRGRAVVSPSPSAELILWRHAIDRVGLPIPPSAAIHPDIDKHRVRLTGPGDAPEARPVRHIFVLGRDDQQVAPHLEPVRRSDRALAIRDAVLQPERVTVIDQHRRDAFVASASLAAQVELFAVGRRWFPWAVDDLADVIARTVLDR